MYNKLCVQTVGIKLNIPVSLKYLKYYGRFQIKRY